MTGILAQAGTVPNMITLVRIILIPAFVIALMNQRYEYALAFFVVAALSDMLDGMVARLIKQKTRLGAFLDAFADKALLITAFITMAAYGWFSEWFVICLISRDLVITLGWVALTVMAQDRKVGTITSGKIAIALQLILISYVVLALNVSGLPDHAPVFAEWTVAAVTVFSGLQYIYRGVVGDGR
jgi:cardiolipin synthase